MELAPSQSFVSRARRARPRAWDIPVRPPVPLLWPLASQNGDCFRTVLRPAPRPSPSSLHSTTRSPDTYRASARASARRRAKPQLEPPAVPVLKPQPRLRRTLPAAAAEALLRLTAYYCCLLCYLLMLLPPAAPLPPVSACRSPSAAAPCASRRSLLPAPCLLAPAGSGRRGCVRV